MAKISINQQYYTKTSFGKKWTELTNSVQIGVRLHGDAYDFVSDAVMQVPVWAKILARGDSYFFKIASKKFQGKAVRGIVLVTPNSAREVWIGKGKIVDALFPSKVMSPTTPQHDRKLVLVALRQIIQPQIDMYRKSVNRQLKSQLRYKVRCAITKQTLNYGDFHIDHKYPFKLIVEDWCRHYHVDLDTISVKCRGTKCKLSRTELAESFFDYHLLHAQLQPTTSSANLKKGSRLT